MGRAKETARLELGLRRGSGHLYLYRCCRHTPVSPERANDFLSSARAVPALERKRRLCEEMRSRTRGCTCRGVPDGLTGPRGLAPSGKDPPWHPNPSPAAAHFARLLEGRNGMGDAWLAQTRFRCDSGVPVLPTTRIPLEAYNVADRTLPQYGATTDAT